jgi:hypothetical protein
MFCGTNQRYCSALPSSNPSWPKPEVDSTDLMKHDFAEALQQILNVGDDDS